jgi:serine O-acetyltransferase
MFKTLREDLSMVFERDPAAGNRWDVLFLYPGLHAVWCYRVAHFLWQKGFRFLPKMISFLARFITGIEIHPGARIGKRFFIDHGAGVVIGETAEIGNDVTVYQGVVLGGVSLKKEKRHPTVGDNVVIGAGGIVLGPVRIGNGCKIGAGSVVVTDIPPFTTAVGIPAKPAGHHDLSTNVDLNHHLVPDPVKQALERLEKRVAYMEAHLSNPTPYLTIMKDTRTQQLESSGS